MPIDIADWNSGKKVYTLKEKISSFLSKNPDKAFDIKEIIEGTGYSIQIVMQDYGATPESRFRRTLETLAEEGSIEIRAIKKTIGEELYYRAVSMGTNTPKNKP
jgi:hypothetical protein